MNTVCMSDCAGCDRTTIKLGANMYERYLSEPSQAEPPQPSQDQHVRSRARVYAINDCILVPMMAYLLRRQMYAESNSPKPT